MLLDEPTNHLDLRATEWLEEFLAAYKGTVFVISHDRFFIDRFVNRVFELEHHRSVTLDWTGELAGRQVERVTVSPLSVTITSNDGGGFARTPLYAVKRDGSTVAAEPGRGSYSNRAFGAGAAEPVWEAYNTWQLEEPVDLKALARLTLLDETIPVHQS